MKYLGIFPRECRYRVVEGSDLRDALPKVGLQSGQIDFGSLVPGLTIVVYEFGLTDECQPGQCFFTLNGGLYAGNALLYQTDANGDTVDFDTDRWRKLLGATSLWWLGSAGAAERAIQAGVVTRPVITINGETVWEWRYQGGGNV